ncbi:hypothetical protein BZG29_11805 [Janthinobacterium sp. LM6]|uniref:hypothetical protein n=1 Tax=Janthinobacterium sp. LM6 TaxID=1938606 RepID=UPI0009839A75|nr:hypothetical protein [Janthinobacterium sp. LM6]AQR68947.1 hypothetical protein BZG29_11805 [Janthinobacterium sp. LM6]
MRSLHWRAIDLVLDGCATEPACDVRYPDLSGRIDALLARADRDGIAAPGRVLRRRDIVNALAEG